jgi:threonine/homoserine/homoserine lactone efflux protein
LIAPEKLAAFMLVSGLTSLVPGPSMLFILGQAAWRGARSAAIALAGVELGYVLWYVLAALGLGTLAAQVPVAFTLLAIGGALYLAWLGLQALRHAGEAPDSAEAAPARHRSARPVRDGLVVAISNPKSLIYIVALLPPFVDPRSAVVPQLVLLGAIAISLDAALALIYIAAGSRLAAAMSRPRTRRWLDSGVGLVFIAIAIGILAELVLRGR